MTAATATGATPPATPYAAAGTYTVTLTVTDNKGATNSTTQSVTVTAPPAEPAADGGVHLTRSEPDGVGRTGRRSIGPGRHGRVVRVGLR